MDHRTQILICTAAAVAGLVYAWRRWGVIAALAVAIAASALAGAYVPSVRSAVLSINAAARTVPDLISHIVS
jgi:hypothetical protein